MAVSPPAWLYFLFTFAIFVITRFSRRDAYRKARIPPNLERVLVLGASSGIGKQIAIQYAARGARLAIVGRREKELDEAKRECVIGDEDEKRVISIPADFTVVDDMFRLVKTLEREWDGIDTVIIAAGVSSIQPLLSNAGIQSVESDRITAKGLQALQDVSSRAISANFTGPLLSAVAFIPLLTQTSKSPAVGLISSAAALMPAPTRSLYCASKAASLLLYQSLIVEHPQIQFSIVIPGTVAGNFRVSSIDRGTELDVAEEKKGGLTPNQVASECVSAVDKRKKYVWLPWYYRLGHLIYWIWPGLIEKQSRKKYRYTVPLLDQLMT